MSTFIFDCPSCSAKNSTFDVNGHERRKFNNDEVKYWYLFGTCRSCKTSMCFNADIGHSLYQRLVSSHHNVFSSMCVGVGKILDGNNDITQMFLNFEYSPILPNAELPPEYLPIEIETIFNEAAKCFSIGCFNAAGAMFRLCLDITTKNLLDQNTNLTATANDKKTINTRLHWLFTNNILPINLKDLSRCIKDDGNDAAHDGSLSKEDAADLLDFSYILLERVYTEPARIQNAHQRRLSRRQG